jgi:predicted small secreted protein
MLYRLTFRRLLYTALALMPLILAACNNSGGSSGY